MSSFPTFDNNSKAFAPNWMSWSALIAVALSGLSLLGWVFDVAIIARLNPGFIPMAPSTAILFIWYGSALYLTASRPLADRLRQFFIVASLLSILVCLLLLNNSLSGVYQNWEHLGVSIKDDFPGVPLGHMSPATALCFIFFGISFLVRLKVSPSVQTILIGIIFSGLLTFISVILLIAYLSETPFLYGGQYVPPALNTALSFLLIGLPLYILNIKQLNTLFSKEDIQRFYLFKTLIFVAMGMGSLLLLILYDTAFEERKSHLSNMAKSQARVIESVARFDQTHSADFPEGHVEATLSKFREAHDIFKGHGKTGEYNLATIEDDKIVFLFPHRQSHFTTGPPIPTKIQRDSSLAVPMQKALSGASGIIVNRDYRGELVLAAYEPVAVLNIGLVQKIDLAEIRAPFIQAGLVGISGGLIFLLIGGIAFFRLSEPLVRSIKALQERYHLAVKAAKDGLWDRPDLNKDKEWWSEEYFNLLGYKNNEIKSSYSNLKKLLHKDDLPVMEEALQKHLYGHEKFEVEYRLKIKGGEYKWFLGRGTAQRDESGKPTRMSGSISMIHEAKKNRETIDKLSEIARQIPISVLITDADGKIEFANESLVKHSGFSLGEILGQNPRIFKSGELPDTFYRVLWETISKGQEWRGVFHNKKKNGDLYWESVLIFPLKNKDGNVTSFIGLKEDITEKKQMESTLIDHERLIRSVINNLRDGLIIANMDGNIQLFNKGAEDIFGYRANEVMGKPVEILMTDSSKPKHAVGFAKFKKTKKISSQNASMEVVGKKANGTSVPLELTLTQMEQRGEILVIGILRDITERKDTEKKMQVAQRQLLTSQKLAGLGELSAGVSHEVMNPLNIISLHTQILQKEVQDNPKMQDYFSQIMNEVERIQKIMGSLLDFSRKGDLKHKKGNLTDDLDRVIALVEVEYKIDNVEIVRDWPDSSVELLYDPDKIRQVFLNLFHNSKYAMPDGGVITISCGPFQKNGQDYLQILFTDTGKGMSEETRSKSFEPFFTTKPEGEGTGLGLSVIHGIIEEHGGTIELDSEEGKGTTFTINLPV